MRAIRSLAQMGTWSYPSGFRQFWSVCCLAMVGMVPIALQPQRVLGAEQVEVTYGLLEFPLSVEDLETFAATGRITGGMRLYARFLDDSQETSFRQFLQQHYDISPVVVSQLTYSPMGETILQNLGQIIETDAQLNGFYALRSAFILAATDPEGLSLINVIRQFPSDNLRIQGSRLLELQRQFTMLSDYKNAALQAIEQEAQTEIAAQPVDLSQSLDLEQPGLLPVEKRTLRLNRDRQTLEGNRIARRFAVDLYLPIGLTQPAPVVVISHGLGSSPAGYVYLGEHLASHGFAVVVVQHLGSDASRQEALLSGILSSNVNPVDFVDRPLDITYTLDNLESRPALAARMDLQQVGVIGHSFGGYTALALAGAHLNIARIQQDCTRLETNFNAAPVLQCLADRLPNFNYPLQDERVKAVFAISPIDSIVLGPESLRQIHVPTMIMSGSNDYVASVVQEQIHPFLWLTTPEKYLVVSTPSGHTYADNTPAALATPLPAGVTALLAGADPDLARQYIKALSLAFMQTHLAGDSAYQPYLTAAYAQSISRSPLQLTLIRSLTPEQLTQAYGRRTPPIPIVPPLDTAPVPQRQESILQEIAQTGVLRVAIRADAAPFGYTDENGQPAGFCVEAMNTLAEALQQQLDRPVRMEITAQSTVENRFALVQNEQVHVECGPNTIQTGLPGIQFSTPFFVTGTHLLVRTENATQIKPFNELRGVRIGVLVDTTTQDFVRDRYPHAQLIPFTGVTGRAEGIRAVINGSIDAFAGDGVLSSAAAQQENLSPTRYTLIPNTPLTCDPYGMVLPANDVRWQDTVDTFISSPDFRQLWNSRFSTDLSYLFLNLDFCAASGDDR